MMVRSGALIEAPADSPLEETPAASKHDFVEAHPCIGLLQIGEGDAMARHPIACKKVDDKCPTPDALQTAEYRAEHCAYVTINPVAGHMR